jgi:hypothetical protein
MNMHLDVFESCDASEDSNARLHKYPKYKSGCHEDGLYNMRIGMHRNIWHLNKPAGATESRIPNCGALLMSGCQAFQHPAHPYSKIELYQRWNRPARMIS